MCFVKFELLSRPELDFEGPVQNEYFTALEPLRKIEAVLSAHIARGGVEWWVGWGVGGWAVGWGTPQENLSGLGGPPLVSKMLIGTGTRPRPKKTTPAGCLEAKLGAVGKKLRAS